MERSGPYAVATPDGPTRHRAETTVCLCGWDIIYYPDAKEPAWIHMATGRKPCGLDELRRPWSAPIVFDFINREVS